MSLFHWISGGLLGAGWFSRVVAAALGMPKVADITQPQWDRWPAPPSGLPRVSIIVPARNEGNTIDGVLRDLVALQYPNLEVIAIDDRSTDKTGEHMDRFASVQSPAGRLRIVHIRELPAGWLGKTHAMWTASQQATGEWLLFTDADVFFRPDTLRRAVAYAESEKADHLVLFPTMQMETWGERMMIAFFQTMFLFGHRPWKVADPQAKDHMGVGAFNLIRRSTYDSIGTYKALRMEVLDDMKLGKVVKEGGFAQRNVFGSDLLSLRWGHGAFGIVDNLTKNFFAVMSFQWWRTVASAVALTFLNIMPFVGIWFASGWSRLGYILAVASISAIYVGMAKRSQVPAYYCVLHPVSSTLFVYTLLRSMFVTLRDGGVTWRGTKYPLDELKKGLV